MAEILDGAIRRAVVIGNGFAGAENQCIGLVRALGFSNRHTIYVSVFSFFILFSFVLNIGIELGWIFGCSVSRGLEEESIGGFNGFRFRFTKS